MLIGLSLLFGGVLLIRGAMKDDHPWNPILQVFGGSPLAPPGSAQAQAIASEPGTVTVGPQPGRVGLGNAGGSGVISAAMRFLGDTYRLGGTGADGTIDCSGLVMEAYAAVGVTLPHFALAIRTVSVPLRASQVSPGDIIGYWKFDGALFDHVALYIDGPLDSPAGRMIESTPHDNGVAIVSTNHQGVPSGYYRPATAFGSNAGARRHGFGGGHRGP